MQIRRKPSSPSYVSLPSLKPSTPEPPTPELPTPELPHPDLPHPELPHPALTQKRTELASLLAALEEKRSAPAPSPLERTTLSPYLQDVQKAERWLALTQRSAPFLSPASAARAALRRAHRKAERARRRYERSLTRARKALPTWDSEHATTLSAFASSTDPTRTRLLSLRLDVLETHPQPHLLAALDAALASPPSSLSPIQTTIQDELSQASHAASRLTAIDEVTVHLFALFAGLSFILGWLSLAEGRLSPLAFFLSTPFPLIPLALVARALLRTRRVKRIPPATTSQPSVSYPYLSSPPSLPVPSREERFALLRRSVTALQDEYASFEEDLSAVLRLPALTDASIPTTSTFLEALSLLRLPSSLPDDSALTQYEERLARAGVAWRAARNHAEKVGLRLFSPEDARRMERARALLALASDPSTSDSERSSALRRLREAVDGLLVLPPRALAALEAPLRGQLA